MRTVVSLGLEVKMHDRFMGHLRGPYKSALKKGQIAGFAFGFSQACIYFVYAAAFVLGAYLIEQSEMDFEDVFLYVCAYFIYLYLHIRCIEFIYYCFCFCMCVLV